MTPLPEYRGFSPTVWAIINGEDHTGVTLFKIAEEVDAGDIVDQERVPIGPDDTIAVVIERVTQTYLDLLERNLDGLINGTVRLYPKITLARLTHASGFLKTTRLIGQHHPRVFTTSSVPSVSHIRELTRTFLVEKCVFGQHGE